MSLLDDIDPVVAKILFSAAGELAKFIWKKLGGDPDKDLAHVEALRDRIVAEATLTGYRDGIQIGTNLGMALASLSVNATDLLEAMRKAALSPTVPVLNIEIVEDDGTKPDGGGEPEPA